MLRSHLQIKQNKEQPSSWKLLQKHWNNVTDFRSHLNNTYMAAAETCRHNALLRCPHHTWVNTILFLSTPFYHCSYLSKLKPLHKRYRCSYWLVLKFFTMTKSPCFSWVEASEGTAVGFTVSDTMAVVLILRVCQLEARARASRSVGMAGLLDFPFEQLPGTVGAAGPELILGRPWPFDSGLNCQIPLTALFLRLCVQHICASAARPSHLLSIRSAALRSDSGRPFWLRLIIIIKKTQNTASELIRVIWLLRYNPVNKLFGREYFFYLSFSKRYISGCLSVEISF